MMMVPRVSALCLSLSPTFFSPPPPPPPSLWVNIEERRRDRVVIDPLMSSPNRSPTHGRDAKEERPRFFDAVAKKICWANADIVTGRHPERWRKDAAGNVVCKRFGNCLGCLCFEYDHIVPYSKGGESTADNCQILQTRVNRFKSDKESVDKTNLEGYSCDIKFTDKELDIIEMAVYGDVIRPGNQCRCRTVAEMLGKYKSKDNKEACKLP